MIKDLKRLSKASWVAGAGLLGLSLPAFAEGAAILQSSDFVGISFWLISMALIASTAFFFLERDRVAGKWKTSLTVSGLVTLIAAVHYFYMRDVWVATGSTPTVYRYIDWLITVPLLMIEFYLILAAIAKVPVGVFWRLMIGTLVMLVGNADGKFFYRMGGRATLMRWRSRILKRRVRITLAAETMASGEPAEAGALLRAHRGSTPRT